MTIKSRLGWFATWSLLLQKASLNAQTVVLQKMQLPATGPLVGISNLFFEKLKNGQVRQPPDWKEVEISPLLQNAALVPIYLIDPRGLIRLSGYGASSAQLGVVEKLIDDIRKGR
jgi:hypothetical protein